MKYSNFCTLSSVQYMSVSSFHLRKIRTEPWDNAIISFPVHSRKLICVYKVLYSLSLFINYLPYNYNKHHLPSLCQTSLASWRFDKLYFSDNPIEHIKQNLTLTWYIYYPKYDRILLVIRLVFCKPRSSSFLCIV